MLYLYAVLGGEPSGALGTGVADEPLRVLPAAGLLVAVGDVASEPALALSALVRHDAVVRRLASAVSAVLPARFGSVVADETSLAAQIEPRAALLRRALALVDGAEQMTLRLFGAASPPHPAGAADVGVGPGARYLAARAQAARLPEIERLQPRLAALVRAERVERHGSAGLHATVYHLVARGAGAEYAAAVEAARAELTPLRPLVSGPWPPYAFVPEAA